MSETPPNEMFIEQKVNVQHIIGNFKNPLVSREQLNKQGATE